VDCDCSFLCELRRDEFSDWRNSLRVSTEPLLVQETEKNQASWSFLPNLGIKRWSGEYKRWSKTKTDFIFSRAHSILLENIQWLTPESVSAEKF
jgi:hypothetical protein